VPTLSSLFTELREVKRLHGSLKNPALWAVAVYRYGCWSSEFGKSVMGTLTSGIYGALFMGIGMTTGIVINREARIGKKFHLVHWGNTKIHTRAVIGDRVGVMHDVTIGTNMERKGSPRIGNDVFIGAGAKILGPVTIGDGARIGANSLVLSDVPAGTTAIGVPARVLQYTGRSRSASNPDGPSPARPASNDET
jgi:serine O-acetyltransferase